MESFSRSHFSLIRNPKILIMGCFTWEETLFTGGKEKRGYQSFFFPVKISWDTTSFFFSIFFYICLTTAWYIDTFWHNTNLTVADFEIFELYLLRVTIFRCTVLYYLVGPSSTYSHSIRKILGYYYLNNVLSGENGQKRHFDCTLW